MILQKEQNKNWLFKISAFFFLLLAAEPALYAGNFTEKETAFQQLQECKIREGLPNFFHKIKNNRQVRVAYLGGSITEAKAGWRTLTIDWLRVNYPETIFLETNAGIGGTGSKLGVCRIDHDVLQEKPDLLFVEFAVNDKMEKHEDVLRSMEGIIRKTWKADPNTDICFIYTMVEDQCDEVSRGELSSTIKAMEKLADYYGIPSIHVGKRVVQLKNEGKLVFTADPSENVNTIVFTKDHTHPLSESGHPIYASTIVKYLAEMESLGTVKKHQSKTAYIKDNWENAQAISLSEMKDTGTWEKLGSEDEVVSAFARFLPEVYKGVPGRKLSFQFKGTVFGICDIIGPGTGKIKVTLDGEEHIYQRFDSYCTYYRINNVIVAEQLENTVHKVEIEVLDEPFDKEVVLSKRDPEAFKKNEAVYRPYNYYIGNIMIVGDGLR